MTAALLGTATAFPRHRWGREQTAAALLALFPGENPAFVRDLVERSGVEERHAVVGPQDLAGLGDFGARNARYAGEALELAAAAAAGALERSGVAPQQVDALLDVSCTGILLPALDAQLAPRLRLRASALRLPITETGCAAGALALGLARRLAAGGETVLVVAVEIASLSLVREDGSRANLVSCCLFGDGAGAAVVAPAGSAAGAADPPGAGSAAARPAAAQAPRLIASGSRLFPEHARAMGFDVGERGLRIVLDRELPDMLARELRPVVEEFLARHGLRPAEIALHLLHPGGRRVLEVYRSLFELPEEALWASRESLRRHGNLSSASVLSVLELALAPERRRRGPALLTAFGPGLAVEMVLLEVP